MHRLIASGKMSILTWQFKDADHLNYFPPKQILVPGILLLLVAPMLFGQGSAGTGAAVESRRIVDIPTAGIIGHGMVAFDMEVVQSGGLLAGTSVGVFNRLVFGISYGGQNILGTQPPVWNPFPGIEVRLRILEETIPLPAFAIGFSSQGHGLYLDGQERYQRKSPGFYAVISKNYGALGFLAFHGGINYSLERADGNRNPDLFAGIEKTLGAVFSVLASYRAGLNDNGPTAKGRGYLDAGITVSPGKGLTLGIYIKDILNNQLDDTVGERILTLEYVN
jgi:hypothetical protein